MTKSSAEKKVERTFLILGIGSLLSSNAYLSQLYFFKHFLKNHNPDTVYTSINNGFNLSILILFQLFGDFISYTKQLIIFQLFTLAALISAPFVILYLDESISYLVTYVLFSFTGIDSGFANNSIFALVSYFPLQNIVNVAVGVGIAGILTNVLNFFTMAFFGGESEENLIKRAYMFFGISTVLILICLYMSIKLFKNEFFLRVAIRNNIVKGVVLEKEQEKDNNNKENEIELVVQGEEEEKEKNKKEEEEFSIIKLFSKIYGINIMIFLLFSTCYAVFPGALIEPSLFNLTISKKINVILLIFNAGDTLGRKLGGYFSIKSKNVIIILFIRVFLLILVIFTIYAEKKKLLEINFISILTLINPVLISVTNGIGSSLCLAIAPTKVNKKWKGKAGSSVSFFMVLGIFFGSLISIKVKDLIEIF